MSEGKLPYVRKPKVYRLYIDHAPVPKCTMTHSQVIAANRGATDGKSIQINKLLNFQAYIGWLAGMKISKGIWTRLDGNVKATIRIFLNGWRGGANEIQKQTTIKKGRGDLDNYIKAVVDGLQYGNIFYPSDKIILRYGEGTGIYIDEKEHVEVKLENMVGDDLRLPDGEKDVVFDDK